MIIAKKFSWEAAHRIPWHDGKCKNLHGHSYKMIVELEGETNEKGIVIDFKELKDIVQPYVELLDHSTIISKDDKDLKEVFDGKDWKYYVLPFDSTAENLCNYFANIIIKDNEELLLQHQIQSVCVKIAETENAYAYTKVFVGDQTKRK